MAGHAGICIQISMRHKVKKKSNFKTAQEIRNIWKDFAVSGCIGICQMQIRDANRYEKIRREFNFVL